MAQPTRTLIITILSLLWSFSIVTYATYQMFDDITKINGSASAAYAALLGIPPAVIAFYQWARSKNNG